MARLSLSSLVVTGALITGALAAPGVGTTLARWQDAAPVAPATLTSATMESPTLACKDASVLGLDLGGLLANAYLTWSAPTEGVSPKSYAVYESGTVVARVNGDTTLWDVQDSGTYTVVASLADVGAPVGSSWSSEHSNTASVEVTTSLGLTVREDCA